MVTVTIKLSKQLESITFEKNHSEGDEWRARHQPSNTGSTDWTTEDVEKKVEELRKKGWS